jgi:tetratricopeptide (TPR) repeat protein
MASHARPASPIRLFFSCADEDQVLLEALVRQLSSMVREGSLQCFHRFQFLPGSDWQAQVRTSLSLADIILLLVSAHFNASDYCYFEEVVPAMAQHSKGQARVIPIILRPVAWENSIFGNLQSLPVGKAVSMWSKREDALAHIARGVREVINELREIARHGLPGTEKHPAFWNVPYWRNPFFTGREDVLATLQSALSPTHISPRIQALSGMAGVGKTQVAVEYAYRHASSYQAVLWMSADSAEALTSSFVALAETLGLSEKQEANQLHIIKAVKQWLEHNVHWLLLIDNLEEVSLLQDIFLAPHTGHILVTTRSRRMGQLAHRLELSPLSHDDGALLLLRRTSVLPTGATLHQVPEEQRLQARAISQEVDGLPLALDQAGAYIEETGRGLAEYVVLYQQYAFALLQRRGSVQHDHPSSIVTTFALSFTRVKERNVAAVELLELCAFLHPDAIPEDLLIDGASALSPVLQAALSNPMEFDRILEELLTFSLVQREPSRTVLLVHRLVQVVARGMLSPEQQRAYIAQVVGMVNVAFPSAELANWARCQRYLPQARVCAQHLQHLAQPLPQAVQLLLRVGVYLSARGLYDEAETLLTQARALEEDLLKQEDHPSPMLLHALADVFYKKGKYEQVERLSLLALELCEQTSGQESPDSVAALLTTLARAYRRQGRFSEEEPLLQRALALRRQTLGDRHPDVAASLSGLANLYNGRGDYAQAEALYREALAIWQEILGPQHPKTALALNNLAVLFSRQGRYARAEPLAEEALRIEETVLGPDHPDVTTVLDTLAVIYQEQARYALAEALYERIFAIYDRHLGREHPQLLLSYNNQARLRLLQGQYQEAEATAQRALALGSRVFGSRHHRVGTSFHILADIYKAQQRYMDAEAAYVHALAIREQALGPQDLNTAETLEHLADLLLLMERPAEAAVLQQRAETIRAAFSLNS